MIFLSDRMTSASGSIGGTTFSHNKSGMYTRARRVPVNTNTEFQGQIRAALTETVTRWTEVLMPAARETWDLYAQNVPVTNALGSVVNISGQNWFVAANSPRVQLSNKFPGQPIGPVDVAPTVFDRGDFSTPTFTTLDEANGLVLDLPTAPADPWQGEVGSFMLLFQGRPRNPTRQFFKGPYRLVAAVQGSATPPVDFIVPAATFAAQGFPLVAGQRVQIVVAVTRADGRLSTRRVVSDTTVTI